jgi:hypothetical protein
VHTLQPVAKYAGLRRCLLVRVIDGVATPYIPELVSDVWYARMYDKMLMATSAELCAAKDEINGKYGSWCLWEGAKALRDELLHIHANCPSYWPFERPWY